MWKEKAKRDDYKGNIVLPNAWEILETRQSTELSRFSSKPYSLNLLHSTYGLDGPKSRYIKAFPLKRNRCLL